MKVLVTGAAGFLGSFLSDELLEHSYEVIGVDNFFRGKKEYLPNHKNFTFYKDDLVNEDKKIHDIIKKEKPKMVFHYAAINGTKFFYDIPYQVINNNIRMTQNLLNACKYSSVNKIIYASSSEIYGEPLKVPTDETHPILLNIHTDRDSYASSKAICDFYVKLFTKEHDIDYIILRIFNTYGPRMDTSEYGQVIPEFINKMYKDKEFTIIGDGTQTRSFCYVDDHTRIVRKLAENVKNDIVNIGNTDEITIKKLAESIHKIVNKEFKPKLLPPREYDHKRRCPDISKLKKLISDQPKITLEQGIKKTIDAYNANIK
ncbi:MAG: NAD-dependent epimerase/dehydratase family protein [Thermoplasmatales archaeon]|nr:MAG: NAD-dependent epimerase/dehydratase family protein [Thermoplasmatales archaeon]